jgi:molybdopterin-guanine dinucleotide biosynthesis protein A
VSQARPQVSRSEAKASEAHQVGFSNVAGAVLTGGASSRMGSDKAHLAVGGVASATRVARCLASLCEDVVLVGGNPPADAPGRRAPDGEGPRCALRGVVAALEAARAERVLVLATDLPFITPDLLLGLIAWPEADAVVPRTPDGIHPLCALYRRETALAAARRNLAAERLALSALLGAIDVRFLEGGDLRALDPDGIALTNLNTADDVARAETINARG